MSARTDRPPRAEVLVDLAAIRDNVALLRAASGGGPVMVVVKADGYGHGMVEVAGAARRAGAEWVAVATLDEALALRAAGDTGRLLCWLGVPGEDYAAGIAADVDLTAYSTDELAEVTAAVGERPARLQLKVDTGLSRGGAPMAAWADLVAATRTAEQAGLVRCTGIWSHLATADEPGHPATERQQEAFADALRVAEEAGLRPEVRHLANSAGTLLVPAARYDLVRLGIAAYGLTPAPGHTDVPLRPAMTVRTRLAMVKDIAAGEGVSYGHTFVADRPMTVGLVPMGYGDGVPRHASNVAEVGVAGGRARILGRVCMDQFVVDLTDLDAARGDDVLLFGPGDHGEPTAQDWADWVGTISYEIVTRMGGVRTTRTHLNG